MIACCGGGVCRLQTLVSWDTRPGLKRSAINATTYSPVLVPSHRLATKRSTVCDRFRRPCIQLASRPARPDLFRPARITFAPLRHRLRVMFCLFLRTDADNSSVAVQRIRRFGAASTFAFTKSLALPSSTESNTERREAACSHANWAQFTDFARIINK